MTVVKLLSVVISEKHRRARRGNLGRKVSGTREREEGRVELEEGQDKRERGGWRQRKERGVTLPALLPAPPFPQRQFLINFLTPQLHPREHGLWWGP